MSRQRGDNRAEPVAATDVAAGEVAQGRAAAGAKSERAGESEANRKSAQVSAAAGEYSDVPSFTGGPDVLDIFFSNPWLVAVAQIAFVTLVGIVCISFNVCRRKIRLAQFDFELKREMLQRGMSAEEIRIVIEAGRQATPAAESCRT